jgi:cysteinyl-tRNA synthetase
MAKSTGNVVLVSDLISKHIEPLALRLCFLENRYRSQMDLSWDSLKAAHLLIQRWRDKIQSWQRDSSVDQVHANELNTEVIANFRQDLDTPRALQKLRNIEKSEAIKDSTKFQVFSSLDNLFGLNLLKQSAQKVLNQRGEELLAKRELARGLGDFAESDRLRDELAKLGVVVRDGKEGQSWDWLI